MYTAILKFEDFTFINIFSRLTQAILIKKKDRGIYFAKYYGGGGEGGMAAGEKKMKNEGVGEKK